VGLGIDGLYPLGKGKQQPVLIALDLGNGQPVAIGQVNGYDSRAVHRFLEPLVRRLGVSVTVSDDLITFLALVKLTWTNGHQRRDWQGDPCLHAAGETLPAHLSGADPAGIYCLRATA